MNTVGDMIHGLFVCQAMVEVSTLWNDVVVFGGIYEKMALHLCSVQYNEENKLT